MVASAGLEVDAVAEQTGPMANMPNTVSGPRQGAQTTASNGVGKLVYTALDLKYCHPTVFDNKDPGRTIANAFDSAPPGQKFAAAIAAGQALLDRAALGE